jgi:hypothetical protein
MKIVVLSDSHADSIDCLPKEMVDELSGADLVVHAGDYTGTELLEGLRRLGNFRGVHGNMDPPEIKRQLPALEIIAIGDRRLGICHPAEGGSAFGIEDRIGTRFQDVDAIVFGHTHRTKNERRGRVLYFNPGSATGAFPASAKTFGIITIGKEMIGKVVRV